MPATAAVPNGWQKTLKAGDVGHDLLPMNARQLAVARALPGKNELIWETQPVPANAREQATFTVTWEGGMGYFAEPAAAFTLHVNDEKLLDLSALSEQSTVWLTADKTASLKYERDPSRFEMGLLTLSLPSARVTPGQPLRLKVTAPASNSRRWFGVCETCSEPRSP